MLNQFLLVAIGGALGASGRFGLGQLLARWQGSPSAAATLTVNVLGCLVMGVLAAWFMGRGAHDPLRLTLMVGFLGGFTTFSSFALDFFTALRAGSSLEAGLYLGASVVLSLLAFAAGAYLTSALTNGQS